MTHFSQIETVWNSNKIKRNIKTTTYNIEGKLNNTASIIGKAKIDKIEEFQNRVQLGFLKTC